MIISHQHLVGIIIIADQEYNIGLLQKYTAYGISSVRMVYNKETGFKRNDIWQNIMIPSRDCDRITPNDTEMMLLAYGLSFVSGLKRKDVLQHYRNHYWN